MKTLKIAIYFDLKLHNNTYFISIQLHNGKIYILFLPRCQGKFSHPWSFIDLQVLLRGRGLGRVLKRGLVVFQKVE